MPTDEIIWISTTAIEKLISEGEGYLPNETGGVLVGWTNDTGIVIHDVSSPGINALHRPRRFRPDQEFRTQYISDYYAQSDGKITYLGDWHTHPMEKEPNISWLDRRELYRISNYSPARLETPIMLIAGMKEGQCIKCWSPEKQNILWLWQKNTKCHEIKVYSPEIFTDLNLPTL